MGDLHADPGADWPGAIFNLGAKAKHGQIPRSGDDLRLRLDVQHFEVSRKYMPARSWSFNQHGNSLMSIVIGDENAGMYLLAKA